VPERRYKGYRIYAYIALARLFAEYDLDLGQADIIERFRAVADHPRGRVSKEEILHAIRSNSHMTEKVLEYLGAEGLAEVRRDPHGYDIRITPAGVDHLKRYRQFYRELYGQELAEHYRYLPRPGWLP
jgi:predicted transcriptional regulator